MDVRKSIDESIDELKSDLVEGQLFILPTEKQYERAIKFYQLIDSKYTSGLEISADWVGHVVFEWDDVSGDQYRNQLAIIIYDKDQIGYAYYIKEKDGTVEKGHDKFDYTYNEDIPRIIGYLIARVVNLNGS